MCVGYMTSPDPVTPKPPRGMTRGTPPSPRQREALILIAQGLTNAEIALAMGVGERTVKSYVEKLCSKFGCRFKRELIKHGRELERQ